MLRGNERCALLQINNETLHRGYGDGRDVVTGCRSPAPGVSLTFRAKWANEAATYERVEVRRPLDRTLRA